MQAVQLLVLVCVRVCVCTHLPLPSTVLCVARGCRVRRLQGSATS